MAETQTKPDVDQVEDIGSQTNDEVKTKIESVEPDTNDSAEKQLDEEIAVFEPVAKAVDRTLTLGDVSNTYVQHEMGFMTKLKFFRLLSNSVRSATDSGGGTADFINEFFAMGDELSNPDGMINGILRLVEAVPEFIGEAYCFSLNVPPREHDWALAAFENLNDEEGLDILDTLVAQNGESIRDFFTQKLPRLAKRVQKLMGNQSSDQ